MTSLRMQDCTLCGEKVGDMLYHLRFAHGIQDADQFTHEVERRGQLSLYLEELKEKARQGQITPEDFRRLRDEWEASHK